MAAIHEVKSIKGLCRPNGYLVRAREYPFVDGDLVKADDAFLKFKPHSACEVIGFQTADLLAVPVPRTTGIWSKERGTLGKHNPYEPYRIGVLIEFFPDLQKLGFQFAASRFPDLAGRLAALGVFSRDEWGEVGETGKGPKAFDFDFMFGRVRPEDLVTYSRAKRRSELRWVEEEYSFNGRCHVEEMLDEARSFSVADSAEIHLRSMCRWGLRKREAATRITKHPLARILSAFQARLLGKRLNAAARVLGEQVQPLTEWRDTT